MSRHRWFFAFVVCLGVVLALPSLWVELVADDYTFIQRLEQPGQTDTWRLYEFANGQPGQHERLIQQRWAATPWWVSEGFKVRFLRPLSSGLFALDHALFARAPLGYHLHCLLWYALLLVAAGLFLRAVCAAPVWQIAFLLFALNASHAESVAWIASRHMLVSTAPALLGLVALIARRERGFRFGLPLGVLGMAVGLAGGESALAVICYWLAYEAWGAPPGDTASRLARLALPSACVAGYLVLYKGLGYGIAGSSAYLDPLSTPGAFWPALPGRLAMLLGEAFAGLPSNLALTTLPGVGVTLGTLMTAAVALRLRSLWPELTALERRRIVWLSVAAALGLLVSAGAFLGSRLLLSPGLGAFVLIATVLRHGWPSSRSLLASLAQRALFSFFVLVHVLVAPWSLGATCYLLGKLGRATVETDASLDAHFEQHRAGGAQPPTVFILSGSDPFGTFYVAAVRSVRAPGSTGQWSMLSMAHATHRIERTGPRELLIHSEPSMLRSTFEGLFRGHDSSFSVGERVALPGAFVTVIAVEQGRPTAISLTLTRSSFDDDDVCLLAWRAQRLVPVRLALHEELTIPWSPGPTGLL